MHGKHILTLMGRAENNALLSLSLHDLLIEKDLHAEARVAWVLYLNASQNAESLGESLGIEAHIA